MFSIILQHHYLYKLDFYKYYKITSLLQDNKHTYSKLY